MTTEIHVRPKVAQMFTQTLAYAERAVDEALRAAEEAEAVVDRCRETMNPDDERLEEARIVSRTAAWFSVQARRALAELIRTTGPAEDRS